MNRLIHAVTVFALLATATAVALAQGGAGGGFQPTPEMMAKFKAWQKFNDTHPNYVTNRKVMAGLRECEKDPSTRFTRAQASHILGVIKQWETKGALSNDQVGQLNKQLTQGLSVPQIKTVATVQDPVARFQRGGGQGGGRPGGPGVRPGGMGNFQMPDPKEYNPLNPATMPFAQFRDRIRQSLNEFKTKLAQTH